MEKLLKKHFGFDSFRYPQEEIIQNVLNGNDTMAILPTGGGKSLCFQLPVLYLSGCAVVISPLISLMKDQIDGLEKKGISAALINSHQTPKNISLTMQNALSDRYDLLYIAPERLNTYGFVDFLKSLHVSMFAIDESHCISFYGHDFRPSYRQLSRLREIKSAVPIMALTATATPKVVDDIREQLNIPRAKLFRMSFDRPNLELIVRSKFIPHSQISYEIKEAGEEGSKIVYCFSRKDTELTAANLSGFYGVPAAAYHAGLNKKERTEAQEAFISGRIKVVCATTAFGMGIDKPDVRLVIHQTMSRTVEGYYQEIGRAGRDGKPSRCVMLYSVNDAEMFSHFIEQDAFDNLEKEIREKEKLAKMVDYATTAGCRRQFILNYFGEKYPEEFCNNCDRCN
jgi:ATP-dependent DNA helicase RecQ